MIYQLPITNKIFSRSSSRSLNEGLEDIVVVVALPERRPPLLGHNQGQTGPAGLRRHINSVVGIEG